MRRWLVLMSVFVWVSLGWAQDSLMLDDFEGEIFGGPKGTVDFGAGNGSEVKVSASQDIKYSGRQAIRVDFDAVEGGYMWVARGFELDSAYAQWLIKPQDIDWSKYNFISFYVYGGNSGVQVAFDIKDNGNEMWRFLFKDDFSGWKKIICPFDKFFVRTDWQPDASDRNGNLDFPLKSFQFEVLPEAKGILYFDCVELGKE